MAMDDCIKVERMRQIAIRARELMAHPKPHWQKQVAGLLNDIIEIHEPDFQELEQLLTVTIRKRQIEQTVVEELKANA